MSKRRFDTVRLLLAAVTIAAFGAAASAQIDGSHRVPNPLHSGGAIEFAPSACVGTISVDGVRSDIDEWVGVRAGVIDALRCAGYDVWTEGQDIVVNTCNGRPRLRFDSREYRLTSHAHGDELRISLRPRHRHHTDVQISDPGFRRNYGRPYTEGPRYFRGDSEHGGRRSDVRNGRRVHNVRGSDYLDR